MRFPSDMYASPLGSYIISCMMCNNMLDETVINGVTVRWHDAIKKNKKFDIFDLKKVAKYFHVPYTTKPIAMVVSKFNVLYVPYIDGQLIPIREDGLIGPTLTTGKIYPLKDGEEGENIADEVVQ